jgi:methylamine dehydrogenase accessory protein MauD
VDIALLTARLLLTAVFAVAGLAKLADRAGTRQAIKDFGLPAALAAPLALVLPPAELAVAVALIPAASAWWGAAGALALLALFTAGIAVNLARRRTPDCHCFGQLHSAPIGRQTLVRNAALAAVAGIVVWQGRTDAGPSAVGWLGGLTAMELAGLIGALLVLGLLALEGWFLVQLLGQNGRLLVRLEALEQLVAGAGAANPPPTPAAPAAGLPVHSQAPFFRLADLDGESVTLDALRAEGRPLLLLFTDPDCGPCNALLPEIGRWQREIATATVVVVSRGAADANRTKAAEHGVTRLLLQENWEVAAAYRVAGTPSAVVVLPDGTVGSPLAQGLEEIRALVERIREPASLLSFSPGASVPASADGHQRAPCPNCGHTHDGGAAAPAVPGVERIGQPAPPVRLPDLTGATVDLADFRGTKVLVLIWNPGCGFCRQMLPDLRAWEANPPVGAPRLLVVSTGTVEDNRAQGLASPVVLDEHLRTGTAFGVTGTPSAVLVDEDGRIASPVAVGRQAVMTLANGQPLPMPAAGGNGAVPAAPAVGEPAPPLALADLDGRMVDLADFRGSPTLVLFWNPGCGFCQQMLPDLKAWAARPGQGAPKLLVVSTGTVEENRAMGLRAPVLLDPSFRVSHAFGATGTPSAVLVDADGRIASGVAAGATAVMALARARHGRADVAGR